MPSDEGLTLDEQRDFATADILTAYLRLCDVRSSVSEATTRLRQGDFANFHITMQQPMSLLSQWRQSIPEKYDFDFILGIPEKMTTLPSMRSLASVYLRFHQGYILLIRPIFIKLLAIALGKDADESSLDTLIDLGSYCLDASKCNMRILMGLSQAERLAKYGFWESLHLFSAINVFALARLAHTLRPFSLYQTENDLLLYASAKDLLYNMAARGNAASKGHVRLMNEIERLLDAVSTVPSSSDTQLGISMADLEQDIFQWIENMDYMDQHPI